MVRTTDAVGHVVERTGVFDAAVSEALHRLADPGDLVIDVGANVGYMTSLLALRVGDTGKVICFEPQPGVRDDLEKNVMRWRSQGLDTEIEVRCEGLSSSSGVGHMSYALPGESRDGQSLVDGARAEPDGLWEVPLARLDDLLDLETTSIGVLKLDVEGHEQHVLLGTEALLSRRSIRDIVFEEHGAYPTPTTKLVGASWIPSVQARPDALRAVDRPTGFEPTANDGSELRGDARSATRTRPVE